MLKKLFMLCAITTSALCSAREPLKNIQLQSSLRKAEKALIHYQLHAPQNEYQLLRRYMGYYRSWYQAVTPPPAELYQQLSPAARAFVKHVQRIAKPFTRAPQNMPGASQLTALGEQFYQAVLQKIDDRFKLPTQIKLPQLETRVI